MAEHRTREDIAADYQAARRKEDFAGMARSQNEEACLVLLTVLERLAVDASLRCPDTDSTWRWSRTSATPSRRAGTCQTERLTSAKKVKHRLWIIEHIPAVLPSRNRLKRHRRPASDRATKEIAHPSGA